MKKLNLSFIILLFPLISYSFAPRKFTHSWSAPVKECHDVRKFSSMFNCFGKREEANHSFEMLHLDEQNFVKKTKIVVVLLHGLSDSPYFYRDIARVLYNQGVNVIAYRHSGHGTDPDHLKEVTRQDWYKDVDYAVAQAKRYGDNIVIGGMSLGGSLAVRYALKNRYNKSLRGLMLFAAAFKLPSVKKFGVTIPASAACIKPFKNQYISEKEYGKGARYGKISNYGVCEATRIEDEITAFKPAHASPRAWNNKGESRSVKVPRLIKLPVLHVMTSYDTAIDLNKTIHFVNNLGNQKDSVVVYYDQETGTLPKFNAAHVDRVRTEEIKHASVMLSKLDEENQKYNFSKPEENPKFYLIERNLKKFIPIVEDFIEREKR